MTSDWNRFAAEARGCTCWATCWAEAEDGIWLRVRCVAVAADWNDELSAAKPLANEGSVLPVTTWVE